MQDTSRFSQVLNGALLMLLLAAPSAAQGVAKELKVGFESTPAAFQYAKTGSASFTAQATDAAHSGSRSFRVNKSSCGASCFDSHRVDLVYTFPYAVNLQSVELWAREGSTTGSAWGGKIRVGHDAAWDLDWWGVVGNSQSITGAWQKKVVNVNKQATTVRLRVWDVTSKSTMWLDDIVIRYVDPNSLSANVASISLSAGGAQVVTLDAGPARAGSFYWLLGSASGTSPGIPLDAGLVLPLNPDAYLNITLLKPSSPLFSGFRGLLDASGASQATLTVPAGSDPGLAGVTLNHAYLTAEVLGIPDFASNPVAVQLAL